MTKTGQWSAVDDSRRRVGRRIEFHATISSTNDRAWELLRGGESGVAVVADLQTAGRGRHGRSWTSPAGLNLMVSVGLHPEISAKDAWQLGAATALALRDACRAALPGAAWSGLALKWPNDLVDGDGRKLAGLLLETTIAHGRISEAVIGAGVNVNWPHADMPPEIAARAWSLIDLAGAPIDCVALLPAYLAALDAEVASIEAGLSPIERYRAASWLTGRDVQVAAGDRTIAGQVRDIAPDGSLEVETDDGIVRLGYGEVVQVGVHEAPGVPA